MIIGHTAGPWRIEQFSSYIEINSEHKDFDTQLIAAVHPGGKKKAEHLANARLIAAAPELLKACREAILCILEPDMMSGLCPEILEAAISKAEGKTYIHESGET